jgi:hypothetical protein
VCSNAFSLLALLVPKELAMKRDITACFLLRKPLFYPTSKQVLSNGRRGK